MHFRILYIWEQISYLSASGIVLICNHGAGSASVAFKIFIFIFIFC